MHTDQVHRRWGRFIHPAEVGDYDLMSCVNL